MSALLINSLASGLPLGYLLNPSRACAQSGSNEFQTLILSTSSRGDPLNVNCPGSYTNGVINNPRLDTARATFGESRSRGARVWCDLPANLRDRLAFFHYNPRTAAHPEYRATMTMRGSIKNEASNGTEMFASAISQLAYSPMTHLQEEPIPLCNSFLSFKSQPLQQIKPVDVKSLFSPADQQLADLRQNRDAVLDALYADMKENGNQAQRQFIDRYALSRGQARDLGEQLGGLLDRLPTNEDDPNSPLDQVIAAVALARLNISPVITINIPFGGDNHQDAGLIQEEEETIAGVGLINSLWNELNDAGIQDRVSFATMNVFGRRSYTNSRGGRDHNQHHAVMVGFGRHIQGGVYGGMDGEGKAQDIGTISADQTMEAAGVSMMRALGHSVQTTQSRIPTGELIPQFLRE
jgi:hypothetical protein